MATAWTGSGGDGDGHQLDLRRRVEEPADLEECHRRVVTAKMPPVGLADLLRREQVFGDVCYEDLNADQVLRVRPGSLEGLDDIPGRDIELLRHRGSSDRPVGFLRRLARQVDGAAGLGDDRVTETLWGRKGFGVADLVRAGYRPVHFVSRPSPNPA